MARKEADMIEQMKSQLPEKSEEISLAFKILNELKTRKADLPVRKKEKLLKNIYHHVQTQFRLKLIRYAAAVFLFGGTGTTAFYFLNRQSGIENFASYSVTRSKNTELILSDGKRVEIDSKHSKIEYASNSTSISLNDTTTLEQSGTRDLNSFNQVNIPYGKRSYILLSEGTKVWLNSGSRLVYPPVFKGNKREVYVEGEAYFEVAENKEKPFYVCTESFKIKVLGTKFVVQAYLNEEEKNTVLLEGKVSLTTNTKLFSKALELMPNQKATLSEAKDNFNITDVDHVERYIAWIYGYLNFENEDLISLAKQVARYYNIEIEVNTKNIKSTFSGKLDLKDDPERILNGLSIIFQTKYEKKGNRYVLYD
jgi:transmembrane sensor